MNPTRTRAEPIVPSPPARLAARAVRRPRRRGLRARAVRAPKRRAKAPSVDIPYEKFTLPNGLRVIVHTDRKAPIVAVNIWYHVGSKDEPAGRSGFAHLFEHLMFNGSENHKGEFFAPFEHGRRHRPERHHQQRPHQLLPERADHRARHRAVDGVRPHGPPARRDRPGRARRAARRGAEREAPGREPALRPACWDVLLQGAVPGGPSRTTTPRSAR